MKRAFAAILILIAAGITGRSTDPQSLWREFESRYGSDWRIHRTDQGLARAMYGASPLAGPTSDLAAADFLRDSADLLGIDRVSDLKLASVERSLEGADFRYEQYFSGLRVAGGEVTVHVDRFNRVIAATSNYRHIVRPGPSRLAAQSQAQQTALRFVQDRGIVESEGLWVVASSGEARPAWRFQAASDERKGSYMLYVDAAEPWRVLRVSRTYAEFDGDGTVYLENPVVTPQTSVQPFHYMDASASLIGKFAKTYNANFQHFYSSVNDLSLYTTANDPNRHYSYPTSDARFAEAMAYFHITRVHDQWRSFGFNKLNTPFPVFVNITTRLGGGFDNAFYQRTGRFPKTGTIVMGAGNKFENFGWDGDVYYHEYGHAVLDHAKPGFFEAIESNYAFAFHEGFGDISACAITGNSKVAEFGLRLKASKKYMGRDINNTNSYPKNVILPGYGKSESHYTGMIVGGAWWDLQKSIGRPAAQQILYRSLPMIPNEMNFFDVRDSMLKADANLHGGANHDAIESAFARHGLGGDDPGQRGTVVVTAIKTVLLTFTSTGFKVQPKTNFHLGEPVSIFVVYQGANLTPGYNLIAENLKLAGPAGSGVVSYGYIDEATNGSHSLKTGAWLADVDTTVSKAGKYTFSMQTRLGGTSVLLPEKTVTFQLH